MFTEGDGERWTPDAPRQSIRERIIELCLEARPSLTPLGMDDSSPSSVASSSGVDALVAMADDGTDEQQRDPHRDGRVIIPRVHIINWIRRHRTALARGHHVPADEGMVRRAVRQQLHGGDDMNDSGDARDRYNDDMDRSSDSDHDIPDRHHRSDSDGDEHDTKRAAPREQPKRRSDDPNRVRPFIATTQGTRQEDGSIERVLSPEELVHVARSEEWVPWDQATTEEQANRMLSYKRQLFVALIYVGIWMDR